MRRVLQIPAIPKPPVRRCTARLPQGSALAIAVCMALLCLSAHPGLARTSTARISIVERALDVEKGKGYEALEIRVEAVLDTPGTYVVTPVVQVEPQCDLWLIPGTVFGTVVNPATPAEQGDSGFDVKTDSLGRVAFAVRFDGDELWRFERDGPWSFCCQFSYSDNVDPVTRRPPGNAWIELNLQATTKAWAYRKFARRYGDELAPFGFDLIDFRSREQLVFTQGNALVVATVTTADTAGTNASPPRVQLRVTEVLYGSTTDRELSAVWAPVPLYMPCPVGEGGTIARWKASRIVTPPVGSRWILAGKQEMPDKPWKCQPYGRWVYSDSLRQHFKHVSLEWPSLLRMYRREAAVAAQPRTKEERDEEARRKRGEKRAAEVSMKAARAWLAKETAIARAADVRRMARSASDIVIGIPVLDRDGRNEFAVEEWLLGPSRGPRDSVRLSVLVTPREDSVAKRWGMNPWYQRIPHDGNAPRAIAFLRVVHDSIPIFAPFTSRRLVDGTDGMLLADEVTVSRTRNAVLRRGNSEAEPFPGCGADLDEFADLNEVEAAGVDLRVTMTHQVRAPLQGRPLVLSCAIASPRYVTTTVSWFPACALPMDRYTFDYASAASQFCVRPSEMKAVLDSLVASPKLDRRVDPADSLSLMVRRVIDGHERVFECTLDREGLAEFVRILTQVFPEPGPPLPGSQGVTTGAPQSVLVSHLRQWAMNIASHMNHQETNRR